VKYRWSNNPTTGRVDKLLLTPETGAEELFLTELSRLVEDHTLRKLQIADKNGDGALLDGITFANPSA